MLLLPCKANQWELSDASRVRAHCVRRRLALPKVVPIMLFCESYLELAVMPGKPDLIAIYTIIGTNSLRF